VLKNYFAQGFVDDPAGGTNATSYYYTRDHLGSIREVTDATGTVVSRYDYSLWGERQVIDLTPQDPDDPLQDLVSSMST
jgi:uncharacterized protein RhaS with RHS repeats